jgi:hypothetical protein
MAKGVCWRTIWASWLATLQGEGGALDLLVVLELYLEETDHLIAMPAVPAMATAEKRSAGRPSAWRGGR